MIERNVGVFRLQMFKPSETFISAQAKSLPTYRPTLLGRKPFGPVDESLKHWFPKDLTGLALYKYLLTADPEVYSPIISESKLDLLHAHFSVDGLYALRLARFIDAPLVTTLHGFDVTTTRSHFLRSGRPALVRYGLLQRNLKNNGDLFICVSEFIRDAALRAGFPGQKLKVHYIGIDTTQFKVTPADEKPRFVHVARLVEKKGTRYLLQAFSQLHKKFNEASIDVIGDGPLRFELEALACDLGISKSVRFHGVQPHETVRSMLCGATALVLPSITASSGDSEGLGIVLLEASATGVPVIGTLHGGIPEAIEHERTGLLVPERDVTALALAMDSLVSDPGFQSRMGEAARRFVCEKFDIRNQSAQLEIHYRDICS